MNTLLLAALLAATRISTTGVVLTWVLFFIFCASFWATANLISRHVALCILLAVILICLFGNPFAT